MVQRRGSYSGKSGYFWLHCRSECRKESTITYLLTSFSPVSALWRDQKVIDLMCRVFIHDNSMYASIPMAVTSDVIYLIA